MKGTFTALVHLLSIAVTVERRPVGPLTLVLWLDGSYALDAALELGLRCFQLTE